MEYMGLKLRKIIKPCPFCGVYPVLNKTHHKTVFTYWIKCENGHCVVRGVTTGASQDVKEVLKRWNTRSYETD